ncbi:hypothetical protein CEXT_512741 [Caerostris extrusa]|uniref:Uncharacterized protein n=1 Tax=Caerostris extrusa TaxID=172846 RepID=A0AAV4MP22_CAEEX|nr:hypothetical protein CEXT_512741 [Caerostris extrusa]
MCFHHQPAINVSSSSTINQLSMFHQHQPSTSYQCFILINHQPAINVSSSSTINQLSMFHQHQPSSDQFLPMLFHISKERI